jgi:hypothetical protein
MIAGWKAGKHGVTNMTTDQPDRRVSGFMENGFAVAMIALLAFLLTRLLAVGTGSVGTAAIAISFVHTAFRIAMFLILVQGVLELFGRERLLLRPDWQRFGGFITGLAMLACGASLMTSLLPFVLA